MERRCGSLPRCRPGSSRSGKEAHWGISSPRSAFSWASPCRSKQHHAPGHSLGTASAFRDERQTTITVYMQKPDQPSPIAVVSRAAGVDGQGTFLSAILCKAKTDNPVPKHGHRLGGEEVEPSPALA